MQYWHDSQRGDKNVHIICAHGIARPIDQGISYRLHQRFRNSIHLRLFWKVHHGHRKQGSEGQQSHQEGKRAHEKIKPPHFYEPAASFSQASCIDARFWLSERYWVCCGVVCGVVWCVRVKSRNQQPGTWRTSRYLDAFLHRWRDTTLHEMWSDVPAA